MKLASKVFIFGLVLAVTLAAFSACSSSDDNSSTNLAAKVTGTYVGQLTKLEPYFLGEVSVAVTAVSSDEVKITFSAGAIAPFNAKLIDSGVQGIIQSNGINACQFNTTTGVLIINNTSEVHTFTGERITE